MGLEPTLGPGEERSACEHCWREVVGELMLLRSSVDHRYTGLLGSCRENYPLPVGGWTADLRDILQSLDRLIDDIT